MEERPRTLRKHIVDLTTVRPAQPAQAAIDIPSVATVLVTSEDPAHPIEHIFAMSDDQSAKRWVAAVPGEQYIILDFDVPQTLQRLTLTIEETERARTQELTIAVSFDGGKTYQEVIRQDYTFSPPGTICEHETWHVNLSKVTHLRLHIVPDKSGTSARATVTALRLF